MQLKFGRTDMNSTISGKYTEDFLKSISNRLSSRNDCKMCEYEVIISKKSVTMTPTIFIYPNKHKRKVSDKINIKDWAMTGLSLVDLVEGRYKYVLSLNNTKRRWVKIR